MTKIRIRVGGVEVEYEGAEAFLNKKLPDLIKQLSGLAESIPNSKASPEGGAEKSLSGTLASFLKAKNVGDSAVKRFLATAAWLHLRGEKRLKTGDVRQALSDNSQRRLGNPADCLSKNIKKGYCEKDGREFYVTEEGRSSLG